VLVLIKQHKKIRCKTISLFQPSAEFIYACIRRSAQQNSSTIRIFLQTNYHNYFADKKPYICKTINKSAVQINI